MNENINVKNREYWLNRLKQHDKYIDKNLKRTEKQLKKLYVEASKDLKKELAYFYANQSNLTEYEKYRLEGTLQALYSSLDNLYHNEEEMLNNRLKIDYMHIYNDTIESLGINLDFFTLNDTQIEQVLKTNWSGFTFSEIIWEKHLPQLKNDVKQIFKMGMIRGDSIHEMAIQLNDKLNKGYQNAVRLVHTETCYVQNQATIKAYTDAELEKFEFCAFLDSKTSKVCRDLDGKVFKLSESVAGVNTPPLHCYCRSAILPVLK